MKYLVVTGGAGFIGSNLIEILLKKTKFNILSLDDYSTGSKKNHLKNIRVKYLKGKTKNFDNFFSKYKNNINCIFHFAEFSRIPQSFEKKDVCFDSNINGTYSVINFCLKNKIKIIYSATSASLGNKGDDQNLSPYSTTKANNMNLIMNLNNWFGLKYEILYFYNVFGPRQITETKMAAVIGHFEDCYKKNKSLPVDLPGTQTRNFTHVLETVNAVLYAWRKNKNRHYSISNKKSYSILEIAKFFKFKYHFNHKKKGGERFRSTVLKTVRDKKIFNLYGKISIKDYINNFVTKFKK